MHFVPMILLGLPSVAAAGSSVTGVVVYPDRAQVTRAATVPCARGATVTFEGIPPAADPSSFRARATVGAVAGLRSEERTLATTFAPEVRALDEQLRKHDADAAALRDDRARALDQARLAGAYTEVALGSIAREMSEPAPNVRGWGGALEAALGTRTRVAGEVAAIDAKLRVVERERAELSRKRERLASSGERRAYLAEVVLACPAEAEGRPSRVELTYLVGDASWSPSYEAHADEAAGEVRLVTWATVRQSTGEEWRHADVALSTAIPRQDATPPEIRQLWVASEERRPEKKVLVRRDEETRHAEAPGAAPSTGADGRLRVASQGLSVQLAIPEPADVAGDGTPARLLVGSVRLPARFAYRTAPRELPFVFRVADLANGAPYPLLPGPLDAFRRSGGVDTLIARYPLDRVAEGERFHLAFGVEDGLQVKRVVVEELRKTTGLLGGNRRFRYAYRLELANWLGRAAELELDEQLPVSELDDVRVDVDKPTTPGYERRADDGLLVWRLPLRAGERRTVEVAFHVDVPSSYDSAGL